MKNQTKTLGSRKVEGVTRHVIELAGDMAQSPSEIIRSARINKARAGFLTGRTMAGLPLGQEVQRYYDQLIAGYQDAEFLKQRHALLTKAAAGDPEVRKVKDRKAELFSEK